MGQESLAQSLDRLPHPVAQRIQGTHPLLSGLSGPTLQPAFVGQLALHPALVTHQPQQRKVGVEFAAHHRLQVELDVGGAGEADVVAQHAQAQAVAEKAPQVVIGAIEELLQQAVRAAGTTADC